MKFLLVHQNFPAQFVHIAPALVAQGHQVSALTMNRSCPPGAGGVQVEHYAAARSSSKGIHPWVGDWETKIIRAEAAFHAAQALKAKSYVPDVIVAHPGWGESLFLHHVWPDAPLGIYCEFYYHAQGSDTGFDLEFSPPDPVDACRLDVKNLAYRLSMERAVAGLSPTTWQANQFTAPFRSRITVAHDGVNTDALQPDPQATLSLQTAAGIVNLARGDEVVTFVNRNLEPARGFHVFMRALPQLLSARPAARVVIVGGADAGYGAAAPDGLGWKERFSAEIKPQLTEAQWSRVHFVGRVPRDALTRLLQVSAVHVYLTYPFVLSWSLIEAMSIGCAVVASDTAPLHEVIRNGENGLLVPFFDHQALAEQVAGLLAHAPERMRLGAAARATAVAQYDLKRVCLPQQLEWVNGLKKFI
jgi:glycosyltransferase involved in cell wall biosynthesis